MYKCEICNQIVPPSTPASRISVKIRKTEYPSKKKAHKFKEKRRIKIKDDPGGVGYQIASDILVCPRCAEKFGESGEVAIE